MNPNLLIIERPGSFRDALVSEMALSGSTPHVRDDAMDALASLRELAPDLVLVSEDPGPPGAASLCRLVRRHLATAAVYRLGDPFVRDRVDEQSPFVPRAIGPSAIARFLLSRTETEPPPGRTPHRAWDAPLGSLELGPLLLAIHQRWLTGRLMLGSPAGDRELCFARGMLVSSRSSVVAERLGSLAVRLGGLSQPQIDSAVDLARVSQQRLGEALLELDVLDAPRLFGLLCAQLVEQVGAACNAGACHARFVLDESVPNTVQVRRLHPLTAMLGAVRRTPKEDVARVLEQLGERTLSSEAVAPMVLRWLEDVGISEPHRLLGSMAIVRHLRERVRERLPKGDGSEAEADALALALLRAGALRLPGRASLAPADLRSGLSTLSPPSVAAAVVRCARMTFDDWPIAALSAGRTLFEERLDAYVQGSREAEAARAAALHGPVSELQDLDAALTELNVRASGARMPWSFLQLPRGASAREVRLACHALHERLDAWPEPRSPIGAYRIAELRGQLDRALLLLEPGELGGEASDAPESGLPSVPAVAESASVAETPRRASAMPSLRPASMHPPRGAANDGGDAALLGLVEPLVKQARWSELRDLLARQRAAPDALPPAFGLLYAIAMKESSSAELSGREQRGPDAELVGIAAVSRMLSVPVESATAVVVAKRALRLKPLEWTTRKASGRTSFVAVLLALLFGAGVGYLVSVSPWVARLF